MKLIVKIRHRKPEPLVTWGEAPFSTMLFINSPRPHGRLGGFTGSTLLHGALIVAMGQASFHSAPVRPKEIAQNYSIRFVHLQTPVEYWEAPRTPTAKTIAHAPAAKPETHAARAQASGKGLTAPAIREPEAPPPEPSLAGDRGRFRLPPVAEARPVKQTLIQTDLPPDLALNREIPLPTALLWTESKRIPPNRKDFVAPPPKKEAVNSPSLPAAPVLKAPNQEVDPANLNVAAAKTRETASLIHPPTVAAPVSHPGLEPAKEIPQIGLATSDEPSPANLISIPETPMRSATIAAIPPANQIAQMDAASSGMAGDGGSGNVQKAQNSAGGAASSAGASDARAKELAAEKAAAAQRAAEVAALAAKTAAATPVATAKPAAAASSVPPKPAPVAVASNNTTPARANTAPVNDTVAKAAETARIAAENARMAAENARVAAETARIAAENARMAAANEAARTAAESARAGASSVIPAAAASSATTAPQATIENIPGMTRISMPKDGKFSVVVTGSGAASRYPESVGALTGRVVSTVYLRVGLRKNWILQYCLPKTAERTASSAPLEAPWPFEMMRQDRQSSSDPDYIMVHGMLSTAGQLDQLAMVFPQELDKKDLLLKSLKLWAFRPARRDGQPTEVEVLLIIPRETE